MHEELKRCELSKTHMVDRAISMMRRHWAAIKRWLKAKPGPFTVPVVIAGVVASILGHQSSTTKRLSSFFLRQLSIHSLTMSLKYALQASSSLGSS